MAFVVHRGTNVSDWLCFASARGSERAAGFARADAERIASAGFDHIRLPLSEQHMWLEDGSEDPEAFELLNGGLDLCESAGLKVIVNLHVLRVDSKPNKAESVLWTDPVEQEHFRALWRRLAAHLRPRPVEQVAYEIFNEFQQREQSSGSVAVGHGGNCLAIENSTLQIGDRASCLRSADIHSDHQVSQEVEAQQGGRTAYIGERLGRFIFFAQQSLLNELAYDAGNSGRAEIQKLGNVRSGEWTALTKDAQDS